MNLVQLRDQLKNWIEIQIADDIVSSPFQRPDYAPFVVIALLRKVDREEIPAHVLKQIEQQIEDQAKAVQPTTRISSWVRLFQVFKGRR